MSDMCKSAELYGQSLEIVENIYLNDTIIARGGATNSAMKRIRSGWCKFTDLMTMLASRGLPLEVKDRSYSTCARSTYLML